MLVFAGAPFTVATYCIGTGKDMDATRRFIAEQPRVWEGLLDRLTKATVGFLNTLIGRRRRRLSALRLVGGPADDSRSTIAGPSRGIRRFSRRRPACRASSSSKNALISIDYCASGADVISLGKCHDLAAARSTYPHLVFQGNVDEELLLHGTPEQVEQATRACVCAGGGRRHIVNLNHGVDRGTPVANFEAFVRAVRGE